MTTIETISWSKMGREKIEIIFSHPKLFEDSVCYVLTIHLFMTTLDLEIIDLTQPSFWAGGRVG